MTHKNDALTEKIISCAYAVHNSLGSGFMEKVYENALAIELAEQGIFFRQQPRLAVYYRGREIGEFFADLVVEEKIICELKAVDILTPLHEVQLVNYLTATGIDIGLLINFGKSVTVKRKHRTYRSTEAPEVIDHRLSTMSTGE